MEEVDCVVVGAGSGRPAVARALGPIWARSDHPGGGRRHRHGNVVSNSEVIHAGIYYPANSLMARFCVEGRRKLYPYCAEHGVPHKNCGKLIVATDAREDAMLAGIKQRAETNGVEGMRVLTREEATAMEPALRCTSALFSPMTGIIDSHAYMLALQGDAEHAGAIPVFFSPALGAHVRDRKIDIDVGGVDPMTLRCRLMVNSAGLHAPLLARRTAGMSPDRVPTEYYAQGNYFTLTGRSPFSRKIDPRQGAGAGGLGVHSTIDLGGRARFGPDVEWIDSLDYSVDPTRSDGFYDAVRRYWPGLKDGALQPGYAGIRPKIVPRGAPAQDFVVQGPQSHGIRGTDQPVRHRKPRTDRLTGDRGPCAGGRGVRHRRATHPVVSRSRLWRRHLNCPEKSPRHCDSITNKSGALGKAGCSASRCHATGDSRHRHPDQID